MRQGGNGAREATVVNGEGLLESIRGTLEDCQGLLRDRCVDAAAHRQLEIDLVVDIALFQVGQQEGRPAPSGPHVVVGGAVGVGVAIQVAGRKVLVGVVILVQRQADLLEVVDALAACGGLAHLLYRRQQEADQHADDGDYYQELDERECTTPRGLFHGRLLVDHPSAWMTMRLRYNVV